jgi:1,2-diacylglycerol 3-alpha-glucosyltransferase
LTTQTAKLKIAMIIDVFEPVRNGTVTSTARFAAGLRALGHDVSIISTAPGGGYNIHVPQLHIPYFDKRYIKPMEMAFAKPSRKQLEEILPDFDCVHIHLPFFLGHCAAKVCAKLGIPCVATHHVQAEWLSNAGITWQRAVSAGYKLFLKTYNKCHTLICPSQMGIDDIKKYGLTVPAKVISNGVPDKYQPTAAVRNPEWKDKFVLLSVGRLATEKAHHITVEAIKNSKFKDKIQLVIAGTGPQRAKLEKLAASLPNKVEFIFVSPDELISLYNSVDLLVHSASTEMEGMVCSEAIACGLVPIIAQHPLSASSQFALDARSLYDFGNVSELAAKIDAWLDDPQSIEDMHAAYVQHAKKWGFDACVKKLTEVYSAAIKAKNEKSEVYER